MSPSRPARYRGLFPVVPTTFNEAGELDLISQKRCLDFMIEAGSDGLCILANFSEQFLLSDDERQEIIEIMPVGRNETRGLSKEILCDIMQPRAVELLQHVARDAISSKAQISSGVILTGGLLSDSEP